jgi:glutamate racemase
MIGVFDSGVGGLTAFYRLRELKPDADLCYLADRENAPYGTKSEEHILSLVRRDIERLGDAGVDEGILIACCTASTVYDSLTYAERSICLPIIKLAAERAIRLSASGRIGVISTEATHRSGAFVKEINKSGKEAISLPMQRLVSLVEGGASDGRITPLQKQIIKEELSPLFFSDIDVLI